MSEISTSQSLYKHIAECRTFAIISHPDAGKTTLTEKLLLYGGAVQLAGSVKARRAARHARSDWMELERQRGISVTSSVMQFNYHGLRINLLDTPGHEDFSEDTYRTLTAADSAVMLIDAANGVEAQTRKLFEVCRMRGIPIFTFINKLDRHGKDPFSLMEEIESVLGIRSCPLNWPIGMGSAFRGVYDRALAPGSPNVAPGLILYEGTDHGQRVGRAQRLDIDQPEVATRLGEEALATLREEIELLDVAGDPFDYERVLAGELTPVFFGSAVNNFGVQAFLEAFLQMAPPPGARQSSTGPVEPDREQFSGFVFKIQANMNPAHRDRIAFMRICSGRFSKGMSALHSRLGKNVRLAQPQQFLAQERTQIDEAYPGDIIGLFDPGMFRIGDTLCQGEALNFGDVPQFSPEHFARLRLPNALKRKALQQGLEQLAQEGAIQLFKPKAWSGVGDTVVAVVGQLQLDVLQYRLEHEYGVDVQLERLPYTLARWVEGDDFRERAFTGSRSSCVYDQDDRPVVLFENEWALRWAERDHEELRFLPTAARQGEMAL